MRTAALLALCIPFVGCATIMGPSAETIVFESDPEGQTVIVDGKYYTMPCQVTLGTDKDHTAKFPNGEEMKIARSFQGWFLGNILLGGLIGMAIDTVTGGINKNLEPEYLMFRDGKVWTGKDGKKKVGPKDKRVEPPKRKVYKPGVYNP